MIQENLEEKGKCFGTFEFSESINEDKGFGSMNLTKNKGTCSVYVRGKEGPIPHFHLQADNGSWEICIRLDCNCYFSHGHYKGSLNTNQCKELDRFLSETYTKESRWKEMVDYWNYANKFKTKVKIKPDYTTLHNHKD